MEVFGAVSNEDQNDIRNWIDYVNHSIHIYHFIQETKRLIE